MVTTSMHHFISDDQLNWKLKFYFWSARRLILSLPIFEGILITCSRKTNLLTSLKEINKYSVRMSYRISQIFHYIHRTTDNSDKRFSPCSKVNILLYQTYPEIMERYRGGTMGNISFIETGVFIRHSQLDSAVVLTTFTFESNNL